MIMEDDGKPVTKTMCNLVRDPIEKKLDEIDKKVSKIIWILLVALLGIVGSYFKAPPVITPAQADTLIFNR